MKKLFKKTLIILIVFIVMFEFGFSSITYAAGDNISPDFVNTVSNLAGGIASIIIWIPKLLITGAAVGFNMIIGAVSNSERRDSFKR